MKLDTEHYEEVGGLVLDHEGRAYIIPLHDDPSRVMLYRGGGMAFAVVAATDHEGINAEFARRGIRPPYVP